MDHADRVDDPIAHGQDTGSRVLASAAQAHLKRRVLLSGRRAIVFR